MAKSIKRNVIVSAMLSICLCVSLIAGATFAIFTSQSSVNIAVTSGKVKVEAVISDLEAYSPKTIAMDGTIAEGTDNLANNTDATKVFINGGTAFYDAENNELKLDKLTPGDKVTFKITVKNLSNVKVKYRTLVAMAEGSDEVLFGALAFDVGGRKMLGKSDWSDLAPAANAEGDDVTTYECSVELPGAVTGEEYMEKSCAIVFTVEAVQGNADTAEDILTAEELLATYGNDGINMPAGVVITPRGDAGNVIVTLNDEEAFLYFTQVFDMEAACAAREIALANGTATRYEGESVHNPLNIWYRAYGQVHVEMGCDIDLKGRTIKPFTECRTFDGKGHTIKNAIIKSADKLVGFFGDFDVTNVKMDSIHVKAEGDQYAGVVSGFNSNAISKITVTNSTVTGGKYAGAIVGNCYVDLEECVVEHCVISGQYKVGGLAGYVCRENGNVLNIRNNTLKNVTVKGENLISGKSDYIIGQVVGNWNAFSGGECKGNTILNVTGATAAIGKVQSDVVNPLQD